MDNCVTSSRMELGGFDNFGFVPTDDCVTSCAGRSLISPTLENFGGSITSSSSVYSVGGDDRSLVHLNSAVDKTLLHWKSFCRDLVAISKARQAHLHLSSPEAA